MLRRLRKSNWLYLQNQQLQKIYLVKISERKKKKKESLQCILLILILYTIYIIKRAIGPLSVLKRTRSRLSISNLVVPQIWPLIISSPLKAIRLERCLQYLLILLVKVFFFWITLQPYIYFLTKIYLFPIMISQMMSTLLLVVNIIFLSQILVLLRLQLFFHIVLPFLPLTMFFSFPYQISI